MTSVYTDTSNRLHEYYPFSPEITDAVAYVATLQSRHNMGEFLNLFEIPVPEIITIGEDKPVKVLDIIPKDEFDETQARVIHLPMGNDLDDNQIYQIATTFAVDPNVRTIAFANPGGPGRKAGILSLSQCVQVARGDMRPLIDRQLQYVTSQGVTSVIQEGFSYGSLPALTATAYATLYDQEVTQATVIEPADNKQRSNRKLLAMLGLGADFIATGKALPAYVEATGIEAYTEEARHDSALGLVKYGMGLARATNLAIASALAGNHFYQRAFDALHAQKNARLNSTWGTESELVDVVAMPTEMANLQLHFGGRVSQTAVVGGKHNMVNDIHLQAALLLQARQS